MMKAAGTGVLLLGLFAGVGEAAELRSEYTDVNIEQCTMLDSDLGSVWACPGLRGYPVMIAEGDLRMFVSFGLDPGSEKAAQETLPPFNRLGNKLEWLRDAEDDTAPPVATILRWYTQREQGESEGQVLVVTQLKPGATCHIAYVDALANADANALARTAAAEMAGTVDCENQMPRIVGEFTAFDVE